MVDISKIPSRLHADVVRRTALETGRDVCVARNGAGGFLVVDREELDGLGDRWSWGYPAWAH